MLETRDPVQFFTTVADRLLRNTFTFGVTNIPVYVNGGFVYTPSVQRLLQVSANIYDASRANFYPTVFRPTFYRDSEGNIFINGYRQVTGVSGFNDAQLKSPVDVTAVPNGISTNLNVYSVPWIVGAKKGMPNFNEFYMINAVQLTRKLQLTRTDPLQPGPTATNEMFIISITNNLGLSFWNSYNTNYAGGSNLVVYANDTVSMSLTNEIGTWSAATNFSFLLNLASWPGSAWTQSGQLAPEFQIPTNPASFISTTFQFPFLPPSQYVFSLANFIPSSLAQWENTPGPPLLPQFGLLTSNCLQAFILDGSNVVDYVQYSGPNSSRNLNAEFRDPDDGVTGVHYYMWSTNAYGYANPNATPTWGVVNQIYVSRTGTSPEPFRNLWIYPEGMPPGVPAIPAAESAFFNGFFFPRWIYGGKLYVNSNLTVQAPYTPTRTSWQYTSWQANDPLVHYLASDLNNAYVDTGIEFSDSLLAKPIPAQNLASVGDHYQPWGRNQLMAYLGGVDAGAYNLTFRDPLVWGSDYWNFPSGRSLPLSELGRIHRGTPWQTIYLKAGDVLQETNDTGGEVSNIGTNTWMQWTGDLNTNDATLTAPTSDWQLLSGLIPLLDKTDRDDLISVNDPKIHDWLKVLKGMVVYTNSTPFPASYISPQFDAEKMSERSPQARQIADAIFQTRTNLTGGRFESIGDILQTAALSSDSPWLNCSTSDQIDYGISDEVYESIPAQLLPHLRPDSLGAICPEEHGWTVRFSGDDRCGYAMQVSTNLVNWTTISVNYPDQGRFSVSIPPLTGSQNRFYRSVLLP